MVRPVKLITVAESSSLKTSRYPATINAGQTAFLSFPNAGLVEELNVREAQEVLQGDVIARLDQRTLLNDLSQAESSYKNAESEYQRAVTLFQENAIAKSVLDQRESQRSISKAQLDSANKALKDSVLTAPFDGVIASLSVEAGQNVGSGELIATVINTTELEVKINLPASVIVDARNQSNTSAEVILDAAQDSPIPADFKEATLLADSASQSFTVTFLFVPPDELVVLPGMNATVQISGDVEVADMTTVSVPLAAISSDGDSHFVWVVDEGSMSVSKREVTVEQGIGESLVVSSGLAPGETIAGAGAVYLSEGMQVRAWEY